MRYRLLSFLLVLAALVAYAAPASAQYNDIREDLEGRRVRLKIDMPGTQEGVDVWPDARRDIDYQVYGDRLKRFGIALRKGETSVVTLVKIKDDLIEFQIGGGGYGTLMDDTDTTADIPLVEKSRREKDLEKLIKDETDSRRRSRMQDELNELRNDRERENRRIRAERERISERKKDRIAQARLEGGSRFNLRYRGGVPRDITSEDIMDALADYVTFMRR